MCLGIVVMILFIVLQSLLISDNIMQNSTSLLNHNLESQNNQIQANTAVILGLLSVIAFSLTLPFTKIALQALTGLEVGLLRSLLGGIVALLILGFKRCQLPTKPQIIRLYLGSLGIIYGFPILSSLAMKTVPVGHGAIVLAILPLSTALFGVLLSRKTMPTAFWVWSVIGAVLVVSYIAMTKDLHGLGFGDGYLALSVILAGFGYAQSGKLSQLMAGWQVICWMLVLNLPIILALSWVFVEPSHVLSMNHSHFGALLFLAMVSGLLGFFSWNKALAMGGIAKISQLQLLQTFLTYSIAVLFMSEAWDWLSLIICLLVVLTVYQTQQTARLANNT